MFHTEIPLWRATLLISHTPRFRNLSDAITRAPFETRPPGGGGTKRPFSFPTWAPGGATKQPRFPTKVPRLSGKGDNSQEPRSEAVPQPEAFLRALTVGPLVTAKSKMPIELFKDGRSGRDI